MTNLLVDAVIIGGLYGFVGFVVGLLAGGVSLVKWVAKRLRGGESS